MWTEVTVPGIFRMMDRKEEDRLGSTVTKGLMEVCQRIIVPPCALDLASGRSSAYKSSEFR